MSNRFLLEAKNIIKTFPPTVALNDVHFCLRPGEIHGLMGENGSGKSTMCSIVSGIYPYDSGELFLDGEPYCPKNMFDLSCASAMIIAAMIGGSLGNTMGLPGLIIGCIAVGVVLGVINGTVYKLLKIPCLIVSLGLLLIYEILAQKIGLGVSKTIPADVGMIGKFPYSLMILGASALLFYYIYNKTCIACHIRAVGNEELLANALGVNAMNTKYMTFVLAGIFIGITAILQISYANSITTVSSLRSISMIFQPLMGVLIAFAIQEWCNLTLGVFISQFTLSMMFNALIALGVPSKMQDVVLGVMLIIVMGIALNNKRISGFFERKARRKELMKRA